MTVLVTTTLLLEYVLVSNWTEVGGGTGVLDAGFEPWAYARLAPAAATEEM